jgi:glycosyltransferase involved in cell wall biosynthesis
MRLCLVNLDIAPVRSSGLAVYGERLALRLAAAGHAVTVVAARRPGTQAVAEQQGMRVERVAIDQSDWIGFSWRAARHVRRLHTQQPFDLVHFLDVHFAWAYRGPFSCGPYVASLLQSFRQRLTADNGRPYASSWHNRLFRQGYYRAARALCERGALERAAALVALSGATRDEFVHHYTINPQRISVVPESVDTDVFAPRPAAELDALRQQLGLGGQRVLVYIGFSTPRKGLEYLAAALPALPPDVRLLVIGRWDAAYRARVVAAAGAAWAQVREVGSLPDTEVPRYLALADLVVLPSLLEGFGLPALEALACGTPVVATNAGSLAEVVGPCGSIVPPRDTPALVAAITALLADEPRRQQLALCARQRALHHFTPQHAYQGMLDVYARVVGRERTRV